MPQHLTATRWQVFSSAPITLDWPYQRLDYLFAGRKSLRLRQILLEHAIAAGRNYTAAQRAILPPLPPALPSIMTPTRHRIHRIWIWGMS